MSRILQKLADSIMPRSEEVAHRRPAGSPHIQLINRSTLMPNTALRGAARAVARQVRDQLAPAWGILPCSIEVIEQNQEPSDEAWWLVVLNDPDVANAYGYHDVTAEGKPTGKVFAAITGPEHFAGTVSHEICEMLIDPRINEWSHDGSTRMYATESSDAVQGYDYEMQGVLVADFVLPSFFHLDDPTPPYDYRQVVQRPFQTMPTGYQLIFEGGQIQHIRGNLDEAIGITEDATVPLVPEPVLLGMRRERRLRGRKNWKYSQWIPGWDPKKEFRNA